MTKKHKEKKPWTRRRIIKTSLVSLAIMIFVVLMIYLLNMKISLALREQMVLDLNPLEKSYDVEYDKDPNITFSIEVKNPVTCRAICEYTLVDISKNNMIANGTQPGITKSNLTFILPVEDRGEGQKMFSFKVSCHNQKSALCSTEEKRYAKTALITVNYEIPDDEKDVKDDMKEKVTIFLKRLNETGYSVRANQLMLSGLNYANATMTEEERTISKRIDSNRNSLMTLVSVAENLTNIWKNEDYYLLKIKFKENDISLLNSTSAEANDVKELILLVASTFNDDISSLSAFEKDIPDVKEADTFFLRTGDSDKHTAALLLQKDSDKIFADMRDKRFSSFSSTHTKVNDISAKKDSILGYYLGQKMTILSQGRKNTTLLEDIYDSIDKEKGFTQAIETSETAAKDDGSLISVCYGLDSISSRIEANNIQAKSNRDADYPFLKNSTLFSQAIGKYADYIIGKARGDNGTFSLDESIYENVTTDYMINLTIENSTTYNISSMTNENFAQIVVIDAENITEDYHYKYCTRLSMQSNFNPVMNSSSIRRIVFAEFNISPTIETELPENLPKCCIFGECKACCTEDECDEQYPIILVHGHAVSRENSPEGSHEAFSKIQELLEDEGYINAGQIIGGTSYTDLPDGEWGMMDAPISVRASYYYITYYDLGSYQVTTEKSENIESYAIKLSELIKLVKQRTGKDKVIIVAHSMGGLVSREYIALFGEESVDKLIMVGTPNHGVEGRVKRLCSVVGSSKECNDMKEGSIFLKRLNSENNVPKKTKFYTIHAIGCKTGGRDGDGIVAADSVKLDFATDYEVEGKCTDALQSDLHTRFLNPDLYPETYEIIKSILLDE